MILTISFDGTGVNLDDARYGSSLVGEFYKTSPGKRWDPYHPETWDKEITGDIKLYFPGPGASTLENSVLGGSLDQKSTFQPIPTPGTQHPTGQKEMYLSNIPRMGFNFIRKLYAQITGAGMEHNQECAMAAVKHLLNAIKDSPDKTIEIRVTGYSRGGITAISFSNQLAQYLKDNPKFGEKFSEKKIVIIDPVYGGNKGKEIKEPLKSQTNQINPYEIGEGFNAILAIAQKEERSAFKPQLPKFLDKEGKNAKPLEAPKNGKLEVSLLNGCHQTVAYRTYPGDKLRFPAGIQLSKKIENFFNLRLPQIKNLEIHKKKENFSVDMIAKVYSGKSSRDILPLFDIIENLLSTQLSNNNKQIEIKTLMAYNNCVKSALKAINSHKENASDTLLSEIKKISKNLETFTNQEPSNNTASQESLGGLKALTSEFEGLASNSLYTINNFSESVGEEIVKIKAAIDSIAQSLEKKEQSKISKKTTSPPKLSSTLPSVSQCFSSLFSSRKPLMSGCSNEPSAKPNLGAIVR